MKKTKSTITAFGMYVPERILTNADLEKMVDTSDEWIRSRTGIRERHIAAEGEATAAMSIKAFRDLQRRFDIDPLTIDLIVVATITPDMFFPSTAALIQEGIGAKNAYGFDLSAACSGFVYALATAAQFVESGTCRRVLVFGSDTMSSITDYTNRDTCVLFGDAASVVLLEPTAPDDESGIIDFIMRMDGAGKDFLYMLGGGSLHPASVETIAKKMHYIYQEGKTVFKFAVKGMADVTIELLERNGLKGKDIKLFIPHQANKRIIDASVNRLGLTDEQVMINIDRYANTTAATIPLGLIEGFEQRRINPGDLVLMAAFGAGFTWVSLLMRWGIRNA
ncbi:MAG: ketoacyl-ACP synthase III [Candidatus Marinimicrobia bacterium]|jgi:3-oxoacyl-[acyl-carrier-protein] synthase-3|nr:ketoacyl-ACP synthase III [Candidatus Neomarinimicrobiota bacterium]